eukprot:403334180
MNIDFKALREKFKDIGERFEGQIQRVSDITDLVSASRKQTSSITELQAQHQLHLTSIMDQNKSLEERLKLQNDEVQDLSTRLKTIERVTQYQSGKKENDIDEIVDQIKDKFCPKDDLDEFSSRFDKYREQNELRMSQVSKINPQQIETMLREFQAKIIPIEEQLRAKIDCDLFDEEIDKIKQLLLVNSNSVGDEDERQKRLRLQQDFDNSSRSASLKSKDLQEIKVYFQKIENCEIACINIEKKLEKLKDLKELVLRLDENCQNIVTRTQFEEFQIICEGNKIDIKETEMIVENHENMLRKHKEMVDEVKTLVNNPNMLRRKNTSMKTGFIDEDELQKRIKLDVEAFDKFKVGQLQEFKYELHSQLDAYVDKHYVNGVIDKLSKSIAQIYQALNLIQATQKDEDDGMFVKKGYQCLSCDKNINNLNATQADFQAWQRLPLKDPQDRIARFGKGFSKILGRIQVEQQNSFLANKSRIKNRHNIFQNNEESVGNIHTNEESHQNGKRGQSHDLSMSIFNNNEMLQQEDTQTDIINNNLFQKQFGAQTSRNEFKYDRASPLYLTQQKLSNITKVKHLNVKKEKQIRKVKNIVKIEMPERNEIKSGSSSLPSII